MHEIPTAEQICRALAYKGYKVFDNPAGHDLNIVGIRGNVAGPDRFDDLLCVFHRKGGTWCFEAMACTTDPGLYWLKHPMNVEGTAVLMPGQYRGAFKLGYHQGKYEALVQAGPLTVSRDNNRDNQADADPKYQQTGMCGINIHRAAEMGESKQVSRWSAGCQVVANWWDFMVLIALCKAAAHRWGNSFTYTLIDERDLGLIN